jgi:hypothetical protein
MPTPRLMSAPLSRPHTAQDGGKWTLARVKEVTAAGGSVEGLMEEPSRRNLFRRELERLLADGSGELDAGYVLGELPRMLQLEERKVSGSVWADACC